MANYPKMKTGVTKSPYPYLEFAKQADWVHVDTTLLIKLNAVGRALGRKITVFSGYRDPSYSARVGGYSNDPHTRGVAVDANIGGTPIGDYKGAYQLLTSLGLESGAQANFYRGQRDPIHVQIPGSGVNKGIVAQSTYSAEPITTKQAMRGENPSATVPAAQPDQAAPAAAVVPTPQDLYAEPFDPNAVQPVGPAPGVSLPGPGEPGMAVPDIQGAAQLWSLVSQGAFSDETVRWLRMAREAEGSG